MTYGLKWFMSAAIVSALLRPMLCQANEVAVNTQSQTTMHIAPPGEQALTVATPVTFGVVFRDGQIPAGKTVGVLLDGKPVEAQVDAKRHFEDGTLKHAVVSLVLPGLKAEGATVTFAPADAVAAGDAKATAARLLDGDFDVKISYRVPEGKTVTASARQMLRATGAGAEAPLWLQGPVANEWLLSGQPTDDLGHADPDLLTRFYVRYYPATGQARISVVTEICGNHGSDGGLSYDVTITSGLADPAVVFTQQAVAQPDLTRWRKVVWMNGQPATVQVRQDMRAMAAAGVVPQYDFDLDVTQAKKALLNKWKTAQANTGLFQGGMITPYMPMTGGRGDLGVLPAWTTVYVLTADPQIGQIVLANDEMGGGIPIHAREQETGHIPFYADHSKLWLCDGRAGRWGTEKWRRDPNPPRIAEPVKSIFTPDPAHMPCLSYVPYVVSGDYYDLEENWFWATYVLFTTNPGYSKGFLDGQLRGIAWSLRTVALAAAISPDDSPETAELTRRTVDSLNHFLQLLDEKKMPLGMLTPHQNSDGKEQIINYAPWQHDYMIMATDAAANAGFKQAVTLRERLLSFSMGRFTNGPDFDPRYGCGYWWKVGTGKDGVTVHTWKELFDMNYTEGQKVSANDYAGSYADLALAAAAIGVRTGYSQAQSVFDLVREQCPNVLPSRMGLPVFAYSRIDIR